MANEKLQMTKFGGRVPMEGDFGPAWGKDGRRETGGIEHRLTSSLSWNIHARRY